MNGTTNLPAAVPSAADFEPGGFAFAKHTARAINQWVCACPEKDAHSWHASEADCTEMCADGDMDFIPVTVLRVLPSGIAGLLIHPDGHLTQLACFTWDEVRPATYDEAMAILNDPHAGVIGINATPQQRRELNRAYGVPVVVPGQLVATAWPVADRIMCANTFPTPGVEG